MGPLDVYRHLPGDPKQPSPIRTYGQVHQYRLGGYWTKPVKVPVADVLTSLSSKVHATRDRLASVKEAIRDNIELPPIEVAVFQNGSAWLVDGNHRLKGAIDLRQSHILTRFTFVGQDAPLKRNKSVGRSAGRVPLKKAPNLWKLKLGQTVTVSTSSFTDDFQVMLQQLYEEVGRDLPTSLRVRGETIDHFANWANTMDPDWDRYDYETGLIAIERGLMPSGAYRNEDGVGGRRLWSKRFTYEQIMSLSKLGLERYLENLAKGIRKGGIPPLISFEGQPADGRHRAWAAVKLRRKVVPVIEVR